MNAQIQLQATAATATIDALEQNINNSLKSVEDNITEHRLTTAGFREVMLNDISQNRQMINDDREALMRRIERVTRDKDVGCKAGTYLVAERNTGIDRCEPCPAGHYCTGGKADKRALDYGGDCAAMNTRGRTVTTSPHLIQDCKSGSNVPGAADNSNVERCDRNIHCKYTYSYPEDVVEKYWTTCTVDYKSCKSWFGWLYDCKWKTREENCEKTRSVSVTRYADDYS